MSDTSFTLTVLSAESQLYSGTAQSVTMPTEAGEITVLPHHAPLISNLHAGELIIRDGTTEEQLFVGGGVIEFTPDNTCRVLADTAERAADIDEKIAEEARKRAEESVKSATNEPEVIAAKAALFTALARIRIAERSRKARR